MYVTLLKYIENETQIKGFNFNSITEYVVLVIYMLKKLGKNNKESIKIINEFVKVTENLRASIPMNIYDQIILTNDLQKLKDLKQFLKK